MKNDKEIKNIVNDFEKNKFEENKSEEFTEEFVEEIIEFEEPLHFNNVEEPSEQEDIEYIDDNQQDEVEHIDDNQQEEVEHIDDEVNSDTAEPSEENQIDNSKDNTNYNGNKTQSGREKFKNQQKNNDEIKQEAQKLKDKQFDAKDNRSKVRNNQGNDEENSSKKNSNKEKNHSTSESDAKKSNDNKQKSGEKSKNGTNNKIPSPTDKLNKAKNAANAVKNPMDAAKQQIKEKITQSLLKLAITNPYVFLGIILVGVGFVAFLLIFLLIIIDEDKSDTNFTAYTSTNELWWPVGGETADITTYGQLSTGDPVSTTVSSKYGYRTIFGKQSFHGGIDISKGGVSSDIYIIASKGGTVTLADQDCDRIQYNISSSNPFSTSYTGCNTSYGNFVIIDHGNGLSTRYAHLALNSLEVNVGDVVVQGQVLGIMGTTGSSTGVHLHYEIRVNNSTVDPLNDPVYYIDADNPRGSSEYASTFNLNLYETSLSKAEFSKKMNDYCEVGVTASRKSAFCNNFAANSDLIYTTSVKAGVNPELVVGVAEIESNYSSTYYNYWGIGHYNTAFSGTGYSSLKEGIEAYADLIINYNDSTSSKYKQIAQKKADAEAGGCPYTNYMAPGTLAWVQSLYSYIGAYMVNVYVNIQGSGYGGCYYIKYYGQIGFLHYTDEVVNQKCGDANTCAYNGSTKVYSNCTGKESTVCDNIDYMLYTTYQRSTIVQKIFY